MFKYKFLVREFFSTLFNRETERVNRNLEKARQKGNEASLTIWEWIRILYEHDFKCAFCKQGRAETMEHLDRLCRGGGTDRLNVVPSCAKCNQENAKIMVRVDVARDRLRGIDWEAVG